MALHLLSTKLTIPPLRSRLVNRRQLFEKLDRSLEGGFVLISAPAGYGKSTLVSAWLNQRNFPSAWLSLDDGDNDPLRFLAYLSAALGKIAPPAGAALESNLQASAHLGIETLLTPVLNILVQIEAPIFLVLDDYHVISNQDVHQVVSFLLENRPAAFHLVIATRADPPLPLVKMRARSQLVELRLVDLRFSAGEAEEFLNKIIGLNLTGENLALLQSSTEGWAAGLQMAGLSLQGREDTSDFIRSFSGENRYILDFLFEEVFQRQPADTQTFLLQTSILEQMSGPLCDAVTQQTSSQNMLEALSKANLFVIALDEQRQWYRYHHLFRDLLMSTSNRTLAQQLPVLHRRASVWFAAVNDLEHAISHILEAQDFESAANLVEKNIRKLDKQNQQMMLATWMQHLPQEVLQRHPWLCVYRAWGEYWTGHRGAEEGWLQLAEKFLQNDIDGDEREKKHILGHIARVRAHMAIVDENPGRILAFAQKALDLLPEDDESNGEIAIAMGAAYWALGDVSRSELAFRMPRVAILEKKHPTMAVGPTCYAGMQLVKQGRLPEALDTFTHGLHLATLSNGKQTPIAGFPHVKIGDVLREWNDLTRAEQHLEEGVVQCTQFGQPDVLMDAYICFGRYQLAAGDIQGSSETIQKADFLIRQTTQIDPFELCWLDELRLKNWLAAGNLEAALLWAQNSGLKLDGGFNYLHDLPHQNLARVLVAQGRLNGSESMSEAAGSLLGRLMSAVQKAGWIHEEIKLLILQGIHLFGLGKEKPALQSMARALLLAQSGGYVRIFVDEGEIARNLLSQLGNDLQDPARRAYLTRLLAAFDQNGLQQGGETSQPTTRQVGMDFAGRLNRQQTHSLAEPLTEREMDVLGLLAQGCSDKQIAQKLVIARETVHKHLKNIYGKLGVHSRTEAIVRARELALF